MALADYLPSHTTAWRNYAAHVLDVSARRLAQMKSGEIKGFDQDMV